VTGEPVSGGNALSGRPVVARDADGQLELLVVGADQALWHVSQTDNSPLRD